MSSVLTIVKTIYAAVTFLTGLVSFLRERRQMEAGEDKAAARSLKEQMIRVENARAARRAVKPDSMPEDDPYLRD